ncbi:MAG TPA: PilZ domain-containing protein [Acidobacteriota bacterium]|nr:PilZ domain-containing protein [Acidobacteriota bacterium]
MPRIKRVNAEERRASRRVPASEVVPHGIARLSTGQEVKLINISVHGSILIHSNVVLSPGTYVRLRLKIPGSLINMDGRVQRCRVIALKQGKVKFEAAIVLNGGFPPEMAERLHLLDEEKSQMETASPATLNSGVIPLPDTAELWVMRAREA